jgi:hypothetical protein
MSKGQRFQELSEQFEKLAHDLSACHDPKRRKQLLGKMKALVEKMDELTRGQHDSPANTTGQATPSGTSFDPGPVDTSGIHHHYG